MGLLNGWLGFWTREWQRQRCALRLAGKSPVLLVGTDGSMTSSADLTAAGGAWVAIGIMDDKDLHDEDTTAWTQRLRTRAGLNDIHDMVGGASLCWGSKDERTVFAGEAIALLMAMRSLRLEHERAGVELPQTVCPIDNSGVVRKYKRILQKTQQELATDACVRGDAFEHVCPSCRLR